LEELRLNAALLTADDGDNADEADLLRRPGQSRYDLRKSALAASSAVNSAAALDTDLRLIAPQ